MSSGKAVNLVIGVLWRRQTYLNLMYLLATLPLGCVYFTVLVTGISVGLGTAVIGIGLVVLLLTLAAWWGMAIFERHLVMWWLNVPIPPMAPPAPANRTWWERVRAAVNNPVTWKSLTYLFVEFPFGIFASCAIIALLSVSLIALAYPLLYLIGNAIYLANPGLPAGSMFYGISLNGHVETWAFLFTLLISIIGVGVTLGSLHALNGLAYGWGQFARLMLGMSQSARRLAEARAVAERERARAERADQTRRELIVNVSHELRTPIASIRGHAESLLPTEGALAADPPSPEETQRYAAIIAREAEHLGVLVDDLLALARADAHELRLDLRPVAVAEVVEEVYQTLEPLAHRERQVTLVRQAPAHLPPALADRDRLAQVLLNLVRNAITYTPEGGIVSIALDQPDADHLALTVSDTGAGIAPEELERIFERFYRTDASRSRATGGSGLGLSIVRDLVEAMGGTVSATSAPGEGSRFRVTLRVAAGS